MKDIKWTKEKIIEFIKDKFNNDYEILECNNGYHSPLTLRCQNNHIIHSKFSNLYTNFLRGNNCCKICSNEVIGNKLRMSYNYVKKYIETFNYKLLSNIYQNNKTKLDIKCPVGHNFKMAFNSFKNQNQRCPQCSYKIMADNNRFSFHYVQNFINELGYKILQDSYINCETPIKLECSKGHIFNMHLSNLKHGKGCKQCSIKNRSGENSYLWKGGVTPENKKIRCSLKYIKWRNEVFKRDNYTCQCCFKTGKNLQAHHIENFHSHEYLRFDIDNGITLCENCHFPNILNSFHNLYGCINNNKSQLDEYIKIYGQKTERSEISELASLL